MDEIPVGLIGYGVGGSLFHAPFIVATPGMRLAAVATSRRDQVEKELPGVEVVATPEALIRRDDIELVVISTPTHTHFDLARSALEAGKHVVVDKPFTATAEEADRVIEIARATGRVLSVYQNRRWDGDFRTVRRVVEDRLVGEIYYYEVHFDRYRPKIKRGWRETQEAGSGILYDLGAHLIDQSLVLFGMPRAITADGLAQRPDAEAIDYFHLVFDYGRRRVVLHSSSLVREPGPHFAVHGDTGSFLKYGMDPQEEALKAGRRPGAPEWGRDNPEQYGLLIRGDGTASRVETLTGNYGDYYRQIAAALSGGGPVPVKPEESRDVIAVIEASLKSVADRRTVALA